MQKITPCLWFDGNAEEAVNHYVAVCKDASVQTVTRMTEGGPAPAGTVLTIAFRLFGQDFLALNGGPQFRFNEAVSFVVNCDSQEEIDYYWNNLSDGGTPSMCGWLKDRFGLSWQVVPRKIGEWIGSPEVNRSRNVIQALLKMTKLDMATLEKAYKEA